MAKLEEFSGGRQDARAADLRTAVNQHIQDEVTALMGKVDHWDVVNEPFDNHDITDLLGNCTTPNCETWVTTRFQ